MRNCLRSGLTSLAAVLACAVVPAHEAARPEVTQLLQRADAALTAGRSHEAQAAYEQAAALQHASHIELGWVRARMQAGGYRQAIAFAAHAAGAHPDEPEGALFYAHLLSLGGQSTAAQAVLARARKRLPAEPMLQTQRATCPSPNAQDLPSDLQPPSLGEAVPAGAGVTGSALLLADAHHVLVPISLIEGAAALWVRNGLGRTQRAQELSRDVQAGTAVLRLAAPLDAPVKLTRSPREAFAGSPAYVAGYRADPQGRPAWPQLCAGFLGSASGGGNVRRTLGIDVEAGSLGAPVFDAAGRLVGLVGPAGPAGGATLLAARHLATVETSSDVSALAADELYERSLRASLQVITAPAHVK